MIEPQSLPDPLQQLRDRVMRSRETRRKAAHDLRACAARAVADTDPAPAPASPPPPPEPAMDSGVRQLPTEEQVQVRREQLILARKARSNGLAKFKKTTIEAVRIVGETTLYNMEEMRQRLASDSSEEVIIPQT